MFAANPFAFLIQELSFFLIFLLPAVKKLLMIEKCLFNHSEKLKFTLFLQSKGEIKKKLKKRYIIAMSSECDECGKVSKGRFCSGCGAQFKTESFKNTRQRSSANAIIVPSKSENNSKGPNTSPLV